MECGFYHPDRGYWQAIGVSTEPYTIIVEPERVEVDEEGNETIIPAVTRETTQLAERMATYPEGTVQVPIKPGADFEWQDGEWVAVAPAPPPVPEEISRRQFYQSLALAEFISKAEALAAMDGILPAPIQAIVDGIADENDRFSAAMLLKGASTFQRSHPLVAVFALAQELSEAEVDDFWRLCAGLN